jgi:hypothetical protein
VVIDGNAVRNAGRTWRRRALLVAVLLAGACALLAAWSGAARADEPGAVPVGCEHPAPAPDLDGTVPAEAAGSPADPASGSPPEPVGPPSADAEPQPPPCDEPAAVEPPEPSPATEPEAPAPAPAPLPEAPAPLPEAPAPLLPPPVVEETPPPAPTAEAPVAEAEPSSAPVEEVADVVPAAPVAVAEAQPATEPREDPAVRVAEAPAVDPPPLIVPGPVVGPELPQETTIRAAQPPTGGRFLGATTTATGAHGPSRDVGRASTDDRPATSVAPGGVPVGVPLAPPVDLPAPRPAPAPAGSSATASSGTTGCGQNQAQHVDLPYAVLAFGVAADDAQASGRPAQGLPGPVVGGADDPGVRPG